MKGICIVCGGIATHHHQYCDKHYPAKSATILDLKAQIKTMQRRIWDLERRLAQSKADKKKARGDGNEQQRQEGIQLKSSTQEKI